MELVMQRDKLESSTERKKEEEKDRQTCLERPRKCGEGNKPQMRKTPRRHPNIVRIQPKDREESRPDD